MYRLLKPLLFRMDAERAHEWVFSLVGAMGPLARGVAGMLWGAPDPRLRVTVAGVDMVGPVGLAAGLDKDGCLVRFWSRLGFGALEMGTVTAIPQGGNPRPRLFRFPDSGALVNRMGFNNRGSEALALRLTRLRERGVRLSAPLGVNLGKSKVTPLNDAVADYALSAGRLAALADYLVINVSSPNTPGLRELQDPGFLTDIVKAVAGEAEDVPVFVKLAPDLEDEALDDAVDVASRAGAAGIIATNTTIERYGLMDVGAGGLSGSPLRRRSLQVIRRIVQRTDLPVVGVGGISSAEDVMETLAAGAASVQLYSALIFEGPSLVHRINRALAARMTRDGLSDLDELTRSLREGGA